MHPHVAVALGAGEAPGEVGAAARLGQELHPLLLAPEHRRQVLRLLLVGAEVDERRAEDAEVSAR